MIVNAWMGAPDNVQQPQPTLDLDNMSGGAEGLANSVDDEANKP